MEANNRVAIENLDDHRVTDSIVSDVGADDSAIDENRDATRSSDRASRRRVRLKLRRRNSQSRDSHSESRATTESRATESARAASESEEFDQENTIRIEQYSAKEEKKEKRKQKSKVASASKVLNLNDAVAQVVETTFSVVSMLTGEEHWALDASERDMLADAIVEYIEAQDKKSLQKVKKIVSRYFPALNLAIVSFAIIYPRLSQSKLLKKYV